MRKRYIRAGLGVGLLLMAGGAALTGAGKSGFTKRDKAFYADANTMNFVRPGLVISITGADISADGAVTARFKLADPKGMGLDRLGVNTPGNVSVSFVLAYLPKDQKQYVSYTVRTQKSPITGVSAVQATGENTGVFKDEGNGNYTYTFLTRLPKTYDATATHTIGAYGSRNLSEFDMGTNYDDAVFTWVPNGSKVTQVRDVIKTESCNNCHDQMAFHGGSRRTMEVCVLCHTPQTVDPDTGNSVDLVEMTHKIHSASSLPSVVAGTPYKIIGNSQSVHDYSDITFPADVRNCTVCHQSTTGAAQAKAYTNPTRQACGTCHDNVKFATGEGHANLPQASDSQCANCHKPEGENDFDTSIAGAHLVPKLSKNLPGLVFSNATVSGAKPGANIIVSFDMKDKKGNPVSLSEINRLNLVLTGPNSDYSMPGVSNGYVSESALTKAVGDGSGHFTYTFARALPADAKGSYTLGFEGRREVKLMAGTTKETTVRDAAANIQVAFSVDGSPVEKRREVVSNAKCNACHANLGAHGDNRNDVNQCAICHNPGATGGGNAIDFRTMIHRIHTGAEMTREYKFGNTSFAEVGYPGDRRNCEGCHVNDSHQLPTPAVLPVNDPTGFLTSVPPTTAACTACHDTKAVMAHAVINTDPKQGESCSVCHGPSGAYSLDKVHAR